MSKMIFITGFARGGTSWLRDCVGSHPDIAVLERERTIFRDSGDRCTVEKYFCDAVEGAGLADARRIVNKAPANAPFIGRSARLFPESQFIFIIRDPRDVLVSHIRGTKKWMSGANSTVQGCMSKSEIYYSGWENAKDLPNVHLVRYEDVHQDFNRTLSCVFDFLDVRYSAELLAEIYKKNNFTAKTGRSNQEDRNAAQRKGVIGDWALHISETDRRWYQDSTFWRAFMERHHYDWKPLTYGSIVTAMKEAGVHFLSEDDFLGRRLDPSRPNVALQHDIDYLNKAWCVESVRRTAQMEARLGIAASYYFLPLDDPRYGKFGAAAAPELIGEIRRINPRAGVGLHLNACERFYPANAPDAGETPDKLDEIVAYAHRQVASYRQLGVEFRVSTAHGYGRRKKLPNNRDTPELTDALAEEGILLFDTTVRPALLEKSTFACAITDVGGVLKPRKFATGHAITDGRLYSVLPAGAFVRYLSHPGNYHVDSPSTLAMRVPASPQDAEAADDC